MASDVDVDVESGAMLASDAVTTMAEGVTTATTVLEAWLPAAGATGGPTEDARAGVDGISGEGRGRPAGLSIG